MFDRYIIGFAFLLSQFINQAKKIIEKFTILINKSPPGSKHSFKNKQHLIVILWEFNFQEYIFKNESTNQFFSLSGRQFFFFA